MIYFITLITTLFFNFSTFGEENLLTIKQQLDRLQREVSDLSQSVFQGNNNLVDQSKDNLNLTAIDMRIYDIERDIKNLTLNFEEITFQIDEFKELIDKLNIKLDTSLIVKNDSKDIIEQTENINKENNEQSLGTLKITSENLSDQTENLEDSNENIIENIEKELSPREQFQSAIDLLLSQKFNEAKLALKEFIDKNKDADLSGSAHYWLGEIYLLDNNSREAALILAEGFQRYPESIKAPDILFKLGEALLKIGKQKDACNTFKKFIKDYPNHKFINNSKNKMIELNCEIYEE